MSVEKVERCPQNAHFSFLNCLAQVRERKPEVIIKYQTSCSCLKCVKQGLTRESGMSGWGGASSCNMILTQPTTCTLNKLPTELRCRNFVNKHRLSITYRRQTCKNVCASCVYPNWASILGTTFGGWVYYNMLFARLQGPNCHLPMVVVVLLVHDYSRKLQCLQWLNKICFFKVSFPPSPWSNSHLFSDFYDVS